MFYLVFASDISVARHVSSHMSAWNDPPAITYKSVTARPAAIDMKWKPTDGPLAIPSEERETNAKFESILATLTDEDRRFLDTISDVVVSVRNTKKSLVSFA